MSDTRRKRIVIDFDNKQPGLAGQSPQRKKSRLSRVLLIFALLVVGISVLAVVVGFVWWQRYKTTPAYSLALLVDAAQKGDLATVDQIVNSDKITTSLTRELAEKASGRYGMALEATARQRIESLVPALMPLMRENVRAEVVKTVADVSKDTARRPFFIIALALPYAVNITSENDTAKVKVPNRDTELNLARNGQRWQIVGIKDASVVQRLVDRLAEDLPAIAPPVEGIMPGRPPGRGNRRRRR